MPVFSFVGNHCIALEGILKQKSKSESRVIYTQFKGKIVLLKSGVWREETFPVIQWRRHSVLTASYEIHNYQCFLLELQFDDCSLMFVTAIFKELKKFDMKYCSSYPLSLDHRNILICFSFHIFIVGSLACFSKYHGGSSLRSPWY